MLHVVLVAPEIPPNTGNIGRLCVAAGATLHLVHPLGFSLEEKQLKRAGLDYWQHLTLREWQNWAAFADTCPPDHWVLFTTKASRSHFEHTFRDGDHLIFGCETRGLPVELIEAQRERCVRIPIATEARSLNLSTAAGIGLYEAKRQLLAAPRRAE